MNIKCGDQTPLLRSTKRPNQREDQREINGRCPYFMAGMPLLPSVLSGLVLLRNKTRKLFNVLLKKEVEFNA